MNDELTWLSAWEIKTLIANGEVSAEEVLTHFLSRIEQYDPQLHSFVYLDPKGALEQAKRADLARKRGEPLGLLHGVPISVKENISVKGVPFGFPRAGHYGVSEYDAIAVERLRSAGAVLVGTNSMMGTGGTRSLLSQPEVPTALAYNWEVEARNPWDTKRVPGWSSSGGAAAIAAGLLPVVIGGDGGGSTRLPAAFCGVIGAHLTQGLVPHVDYQRPTLRLTASCGPISRSAHDIALVTKVLAGPDGRDYVCIPHDAPDYLAGLDDGVVGMRLAWTDDYGYAPSSATKESARVVALVRTAAFSLQTLGASVEKIDQAWEPSNRGGGPAPGEPGVYEIEVGGSTPVSLPPTDAHLYKEAMEWRACNWSAFHTLFREYDLLLSVTSQWIAPTVQEWDEAWMNRPAEYATAYTRHTVLCNLLGLPAVSIPCGTVDGMPVAMQIVGPPGSERKIFRLASAFQKAFPFLEKPILS